MDISIRDEKGQAVIEYILVLVVAIAIIFGGLYQLNTAFQGWATNYFGDYLSCLLETGELPSISGTGGDAGVCNQLFKPFSIAEGRKLAAVQATGGGGDTKKNNSGGIREHANLSRVNGGGGGGGGARGYGGTPFTAGKGFGKNGGANAGPGVSKLDQPAQHGAQTTNYGNAFTGYSNKPPARVKLDQRFMLDEQRERRQSSATPIGRTPSDSSVAQGSKKVTYSNTKKSSVETANTGLTVADFLRYIIIAGIIVALLVFLGGQALQIGKSMD